MLNAKPKHKVPTKKAENFQHLNFKTSSRARNEKQQKSTKDSHFLTSATSSVTPKRRKPD